MNIKQNTALSSLFDNVIFEIRENGHAYCDRDWYQTNGKNSSFSRLYYIIDGEGIIELNSGKVKMTPGNLYFLPLGLNYMCKCDKNLEKMYFHVNIFLAEAVTSNDLFYNCREIFTLSSDNIKKLSELYENKDILSFFKIKSILYNDIIRIMETYNINMDNIKCYNRFCRDIVDFIDNNLSAKLKIKDIAAEFLISESNLNKKFYSGTGIQLGKFIDDKLFVKVEDMVMHTDISISEIGEIFQFSDPMYLSKFFKRKTGYSPKQYRRMNLKNDMTL